MNRSSVPVAGERPLTAILDTMQSWIDGEPVWSYRTILDVWGPEFEMYRARWDREHREAVAAGYLEGRKPDFERMVRRGVAIFHLRDEWIARFGFAIPCAELLDELAKAEHVIDVGAGTGYMTRLMRQRGIEVIGTDTGDGEHGFDLARHDPQQLKVPAKTMVRRHPDSTVFCSWPTLKATWFRQTLKAMRIGQRLVIIREDACAEDTAWQYLDDCFDELAVINIPAFEHMNDYASVHVKKRQRTR